MLDGSDFWSPHPHIWFPTFTLPLFYPLKKPRFAFPLQFPLKIPLLKLPFPFQQLAALTVTIIDAIKNTTNKILNILFVLLAICFSI